MGHQPLTILPDALQKAGFEAMPYRSLYTAAVDRRIPAKRGANGRWTFLQADVNAIAEAMGLASAEAHAA